MYNNLASSHFHHIRHSIHLFNVWCNEPLYSNFFFRVFLLPQKIHSSHMNLLFIVCVDGRNKYKPNCLLHERKNIFTKKKHVKMLPVCFLSIVHSPYLGLKLAENYRLHHQKKNGDSYCSFYCRSLLLIRQTTELHYKSTEP